MIENNILLYYTTLETSEKILRTKRIRMSLLQNSKDTFEAEIPYHRSVYNIYDKAKSTSAYNADDLQIVCFSKGTFPILDCSDDETEYSLTVPAMFNTYSDFGEGMCFLLDKVQFEIDNKLEKRDIEYEKYPFSKFTEAFNKYSASKSPSTFYDMFKYKHCSFGYENEIRYFKKSKGKEFVDISSSLLGVCRGPRLSNICCKKLKEISTLVALDLLVLKRITDEGIRLFHCGELNGGLELQHDGFWEILPSIEIDAEFPYRRCISLAPNKDNNWKINLKDKGMTNIKIINSNIISFHNNTTGRNESWLNNQP